MSPELEELIRAYDAVTLADNEQASEAWKAFEALMDAAVARRAHLDRERLKRAVHHAHRRRQRAHDKPTTLPPKA
ncbi:MAG: hypothetical protein HY735_34580 [Verrucomicrobia bacterium]|nr:hypothetical protein [Verrucomicrobiota bacterium]